MTASDGGADGPEGFDGFAGVVGALGIDGGEAGLLIRWVVRSGGCCAVVGGVSSSGGTSSVVSVTRPQPSIQVRPSSDWTPSCQVTNPNMSAGTLYGPIRWGPGPVTSTVNDSSSSPSPQSSPVGRSS